MADISNKSVGMLLMAMVVVSLASTVIVLKNLGERDVMTGYAPTSTGIVNLSFDDVISITTADGNLVNFGPCVTNDENLTIETNSTTNNCSWYVGTANISNLSVRNDGNVHVNVTLRPSLVGEVHGGNFLKSPDNGSWIAYRSSNASRNVLYNGGCHAGLQATYLNMTSNTVEYMVCQNLTSGQNNSVVVNYRIFIPKSVRPGVQTNTMTFTATKRI